MKNLIKSLCLICFTVFLTQCQQSAELSKADVILELKEKLRNDPDVKIRATLLKNYTEKIGTGYFNEDKANDKYIDANWQRVKNGEEQAVYEEAGYKHTAEYLKNYHAELDLFKVLLKRYDPYQKKLGDEEYFNIFQNVSNELVPISE